MARYIFSVLLFSLRDEAWAHPSWAHLMGDLLRAWGVLEADVAW